MHWRPNRLLLPVSQLYPTLYGPQLNATTDQPYRILHDNVRRRSFPSAAAAVTTKGDNKL